MPCKFGKDVFYKNPVLMNLLEKREDGVYYELLVGLENIPGAISKVSSTISFFKANIWSGFHATIEDVGGAWVFFLEVSPPASIDGILEKLKGLKEVREVKFRRLEKTDYFDVFFFPLCIGEKRIIILTNDAFISIKQHLIELLDTGGESILFNEGMEAGDTILKSLPQSLKTCNEKLNYLKDFTRATGWGILEYRELNALRRTGEIHLYNNVEADPRYHGRCHFSRGILTSFIRHIFEDDRLNLVEIECIGSGAPKCVFKLV